MRKTAYVRNSMDSLPQLGTINQRTIETKWKVNEYEHVKEFICGHTCVHVQYEGYVLLLSDTLLFVFLGNFNFRHFMCIKMP